jgi:5-methylcytosine-specific restriction endonuclease McrA
VLKIKDIKEITKNPDEKGYLITFNDGRAIKIHKRRTIPALLTLIKHGEGCENDLTSLTTNLRELKNELKGRIPENLIQDSYSDANKPFSELWNEEGFAFIRNPIGEKRQGSQKYVLDILDHDKLFTANKKAERKPPDRKNKEQILKKQNGKCNLCGSTLKESKDIEKNTFARDRVRLVWDHRIPVEKSGNSEANNYQALCFSCNKYKWQICNICSYEHTDCQNCVLSAPEKSNIVLPTKEDISDRLKG